MQTEPVQVIDVPHVIRLTGTLRGDREADLAANAAGRVLSTSVERGEQIKPGQVLAKLDTRAASLSATEARAQAASTRAQEEQARAECKRYEELKGKGAISDMEYQERVTQCRMLPFNLQAASARAALAAQNVGDGLIRAPFAGVVTERYVEVGQFVRQDTRVVSIVSVDPLRLEIAVPETHVAHVVQGAELTFTVASYPGKTFDGKVKFVSGALRPATRDLVVEAVCRTLSACCSRACSRTCRWRWGRIACPACLSGRCVRRTSKTACSRWSTVAWKSASCSSGRAWPAVSR